VSYYADILDISNSRRLALSKHPKCAARLAFVILILVCDSQSSLHFTTVPNNRMSEIAAASAAAGKTVHLVSQEGESFEVSLENAKMSELVKTMIDEEQDDDEAQEIPLPNVKSAILAKVIEFIQRHKTEPMSEIEKVSFFSIFNLQFFFFNFRIMFSHLNTFLDIEPPAPSPYSQPLKSAQMSEVVQEWYANFVNVEQEVLFELILAANFMDIKPLLDLTCATVASMIKGKTPEEIRKTFNIVNDFTPEEEAQVREENKWCEDA